MHSFWCLIKTLFCDRDPGNISCWFWSLSFTFLSTQFKPRQRWYFFLHWFSRCFKFSMLYEEKTWEWGKKRCVSHGEQLQKGTGGEGVHLCRPNDFHTSWALALYPLYCCTSPFPPLCFRNFILFPRGEGSVCPITFPFHSCTVAFIIPYPSTVCFIPEFYNPHLRGALFSFHHFFSIRGVVCLYVFIHYSFSLISR